MTSLFLMEKYLNMKGLKMFKNEKHALIVLYILNNYGIEEKINDVSFNDDSEIVEGVEYRFDLKHDLNKLFDLFTDMEKDILMLYVYYENKHRASVELQIPYTTYRRKFSKCLKKWRDILIKHKYINL